jgi:spore coat protein U-like protein
MMQAPSPPLGRLPATLRHESPRLLALFGSVVVILAATTAPSLCSISNATPLIFDTIFDTIYDGERPDDGRASFVVTCASTHTTSIALLYSHRMTSGTKGSDLLYDLYATPDHSSIWGSGDDEATVAVTFSGGRPATMYIYARIPAHQHPVPAHFTDSIEIVTLP